MIVLERGSFTWSPTYLLGTYQVAYLRSTYDFNDFGTMFFALSMSSSEHSPLSRPGVTKIIVSIII